MFKFKYRIQLKNNKTLELFGKDYFNDKKVFYETHISMLNVLYHKVCKTGLPIVITNLESNKKLIIKYEYEFNKWLRDTQPIKEFTKNKTTLKG